MNANDEVSSIQREARDKRFTTVDNEFINDKRLSGKATGWLLIILSKPDHWQVIETHLATLKTDGRDSVRSALKELEQCGYLTRTHMRRADGTFYTKSVVHERPKTVTVSDNPTRNRVGFSNTDNPTLVSTDVASTEPTTLLLHEETPVQQPYLLPETTDAPLVAGVPPKSAAAGKRAAIFPLMLACSEALLGLTEASSWTPTQKARMAQDAEKVYEKGLDAKEVLAWLHGPWKAEYWGQQGQLPIHDTFMLHMSRLAEKKNKTAAQPAFILVPDPIEEAREQARIDQFNREFEERQLSKEDNHA